jgi:nucleoside-diphosphate-sugar epimerase
MPISIIGRQSELGKLLAHHAGAGPDLKLLVNLAGQQANTLLHDGHAWKDFDKTLKAGVRRSLRADADFIVFASFAFVQRIPPKDPLRSLAETILACEQQVLAGPVPACVVRLGYLYGPTSQDLLAYRKAFRLGRPYWAGPRTEGQFHLHHDDAVRALLLAANPRHAGKTFYATAGGAVPFMRFMDYFARGIGKRCPLHIPLLAAPVMQLIVRKEHMQQVALAMPSEPPRPQLPRWKPKFADYRRGIDSLLADWQAPSGAPGSGTP